MGDSERQQQQQKTVSIRSKGAELWSMRERYCEKTHRASTNIIDSICGRTAAAARGNSQKSGGGKENH